jgi:ABC-type glycerol-3-phosphate transport system substrate-binding protein
VQVVKEPQVVKETVEVTKEITATPPAPLTLHMWHHWGGTREPLMIKAAEDFAARNPGLTIEQTLIPWDRKEESILTAVAAGQAPDVLMLNAAEMPPYAMADALIPIDDLVAQTGIKPEEVYESEWQATSYMGKIWGLPQTVGGAACLLFYNPQLFEEAGLDPAKPPVTWSETLAAAKALLKTDDKGDILRLGLGLGVNMWSWLNFLAQNDAPWLSDDGREVKMDNEAAVEALQWVVDVMDAQGGHEKLAAFSAAAGDRDPFMAEMQVMEYNGVWQFYLIKTNAPELQFKSAVAPNNKGNWHEGNYGPHLYVLPKGSKNDAVEESWKLVLWFTRGAGQCTFLIEQLRPSPWKECTENSPLAKVADYWPVVVEALNAARPEPLTPLFNKFGSIWDEMGERAQLKASTPAEAVKWAAGEMAKANDAYWARQS